MLLNTILLYAIQITSITVCFIHTECTESQGHATLQHFVMTRKKIVMLTTVRSINTT